MSLRLLVVPLALGVVACSSNNNDMCAAKRVVCTDATTVCDPDDGVCKCGGHGGVVCQMGFVCDQATNTCLSTRCAGVDCTAKPGTSCDVYDGVCKCGGTGGHACMSNETCDPGSKQCFATTNCNDVACPKNQTCEAATGICRCGSGTCMPTQFCSPAGDDAGTKTCVDDVCARTHCAGANKCDPADGYCKCNTLFCQSGEACACPPTTVDGGTCDDSARSCQPGGSCTGVTCGNGTTCDPVDGQCKCGGPGGPVCASNQICALGPPPQCQGGAQCTLLDGGAKGCPAGFSCDPEDGVCKCGGQGGQVCAPADGGEPAEVCIASALQQACKRPCDVRTPDCATGLSCFFDSAAAVPQSYCAAPTGTQAQDQACTVATACFNGSPPRAMHCNGLALGQTGICRPYCDVAAGTGGCLQTPVAEICTAIANAPANYGYCQNQ